MPRVFFSHGDLQQRRKQRQIPQSVSPQRPPLAQCRGGYRILCHRDYNPLCPTSSCTRVWPSLAHTPHSPHQIHDNRPNRHVAAHISSSAPIATHPTRLRLLPQRFNIVRPSPRLTLWAQLPLLLFAGTCSQLHPAGPRSRPGATQRHPSLREIFCSGYWPRRTYPITTHVGIFRRSVCGNVPVRSISPQFHHSPVNPRNKNAAHALRNQPPKTPHAPPRITYQSGKDHCSSLTTTYTTFFSAYHLHNRY